MNCFDDFEDILKNPNAYGRRLKKETGKKVVGYFCSYVPEELIIAAGAHPFRIFGTKGDIRLADAHFQSYCCSLVRGALEEGLSGGLDFLDGVIFPHTCDSIQRLSDIWRLNIPGMFHADFVLPVKLDTESAKNYYIAVLRRLKADIEKGLKARITDEDLGRAIHTCNAIRECVHRIYRLRQENPFCISGRELYGITHAAMAADRNHLLEALPGIAQSIAARTGDRREGKRLILSGGICTHPDIYDIIEEAGGVVIWDDFCTGSRYFEGAVGDSADPVSSIAERYLKRVVCPAKFAGLSSRGYNLLRLAKEKRVDGVIFIFLKFCDPHAFDYPYMKELLDREGIPNMLFETEQQLPSRGQMQTRFETFMEMI
ncbi:MAG: 2-hydroxyacyl-CoA dehydratase subunit D [Syntrophales bacterium]